MSTGRVAEACSLLAALVVLAGLSVWSSPPVAASDDPRFAEQWNLTQIGAPQAWPTSKGAGVKIGVVDSGIDDGHPDLAGRVEAQANCLGGSCVEGDAPDGDGHGTIVAGIAAAHTDNREGVAGVAPDSRLVVAKALDDQGRGTTEDINNAIRWVVDHGAKVVNLSLGDPDQVFVRLAGTSLKSGIEYAWSRGAIPVLASGNYRDGLSEEGSGFGNLDAVVVGATDRSGAVAPYSSPLGNAKWGVVAPGGGGPTQREGVLGPVPGAKYAQVAGTSVAAPHVSGTLALLLAQGRSPSAAVNALLSSLDRSAPCGQGCQGRVRADAAVATPGVRPASPAVTPPLATQPARVGSDSESDGTSGTLVAKAVAAVGVFIGAVGVGAVVWRRRIHELA